MKPGMIGLIIGAVVAIVLVQWGWLTLLLIAGLAIAGYLIERWLLPRQDEIKEWLQNGKHALMKED